ncbi:hypothetical protein BDZ45DRAFT_422005 [Acephala macrosclerotiorum]|nr:hypothetical protein BDZ45DRAFT_422005 [Acephala macrosclerotiorum]
MVDVRSSFLKSRQISWRSSAANGDIALDTKPDNQPCTRHYKKTKDQYGAILDNLGAFARCCYRWTLSHAVLSSLMRLSARSDQQRLKTLKLQKMLREICPTLYKSMTSMETKKADNYCKKSCCAVTLPR